MQEHADKRGVQALLDIATTVSEALVKFGTAAARAEDIGLLTAAALRDTYGGEQLYIPKALGLAISDRDREIYSKYDGNNTFALSKEYGLTERQIYICIGRIREEETVKRQMRLFDQE